MQQKSVLRKYPSFIQNMPVGSYQGLKKLQYVDSLHDLQRITTWKDSKNYSM